jgi:hypothetical protein
VTRLWALAALLAGCSLLNRPVDSPDPDDSQLPPGDSDGPGDSDEPDDTDETTTPDDTGPPDTSDTGPPDTSDTDCPEGYERVGDECLPSCGVAGGDTCVAAGSNMCDGLEALATYDCELCCDRSVYPGVAAHSFHIIDRDDIYSWDAIRSIAERDTPPLICSQNKPKDLDHAHWASKINATWYSSGQAMAEAIHGQLQDPATTPQVVMIDELRSDTHDLVYEAAEYMRAHYPQWNGRWGAFLVHGSSVSYANLNPAVDSLFDAQAHVVPEIYPAQSSYCSAGSSDSARDAWLVDFIDGTSSLARLNWLIARRTYKGSSSNISVLFGVIDAYMDGTYAAWFLDRMFYVFAAQSDNAWVIGAANGGPGAYKWDDPSMSNTSRDLAFYESYEHYVTGGSTSSRQGSVNCD